MLRDLLAGLRRRGEARALPSGIIEVVARFDSEARAAAALNHPNILSVYDVGRLRAEGASASASAASADNPASQGPGETIAYLVTELLEGRTLRAVIDGGAVPLPRAWLDLDVRWHRALILAQLGDARALDELDRLVTGPSWVVTPPPFGSYP